MLEDYLNVRISLDGDKWCASVGEDLQVGLAGFGDSPIDALSELVLELKVHGWNIGDINL